MYNMISGKISVIMGVYNCEQTVIDSINSIINQTYQNWEFIICDDGSSDNTFNLISNYVLNDSKFILIKNDKNKGLNYTLNRCLQYVNGEYIARQDGDDISITTRFEEQIKEFNNNPQYSIISSSMSHFDENGIFCITSKTIMPTKYDFLNGTPFNHAPSMIRTEAMLSVGGYSVDDRLLRVEDYHLWFKMYNKGYRGYNILKPLYMMRDDRNALSRRKFKYRMNEAYVKCIGFKMLKLPFYYYIFALRPIIVGLCPSTIYLYFHRRGSR